MRKTNLLGATILALTIGAWSLNAVAQTPAPAPMATPAPAPAPAPAPEPTPAPAAPEAAPAAPAPDAAPAKPMPAKKMHHKTMHGAGKLAPTKAGDKAVEDLNDASLNAAKTGKPFVAPPTPEAAKKEAHMKPAKKHMKMAKPAAPATPPADTSGK